MEMAKINNYIIYLISYSHVEKYLFKNCEM